MRQANITTEITDENVFTQCPGCGSEVSIDLVELFSDGAGDLFGTAVYCADCTKKRANAKQGFDAPITFDGLSWLTNVLGNAGYGELIDELYTKYDIESLHDLPTTRYKSFGCALADIACGNMGD